MMAKKPSRYALSDQDKKLWSKVTENITKLESNQTAAPLVRKAYYTRSMPDHTSYNPSSARFHAPAASLTDPSFTLRNADHNWQQKLRKGKFKPDGKIDLHGMTQDHAFAVLNRTIEQAQKRGKRFILVITGKGGGKSGYGDKSSSDYKAGRGILKTNVPRWLSQGALASRIISFYSANPEHGGDGAIYVVLKRIRDR